MPTWILHGGCWPFKIMFNSLGVASYWLALPEVHVLSYTCTLTRVVVEPQLGGHTHTHTSQPQALRLTSVLKGGSPAEFSYLSWSTVSGTGVGIKLMCVIRTAAFYFYKMS
ncbi:hypothetical protein XELAEV_18035970mg [Xenopus laevis]|uniref:Uncharacterized protein n=1 Tax=Xenopus laevis TaxID=8355 RepID=A0A974CGG5_XENLA|nr:hypothetical protein XELAEV_18035970mg [Xenopus laevis]